MLHAWHHVHAEVAAECKYMAADRDLPAAFVRQRLPAVQGETCRAITDREGAAFLATHDICSAAGRKHAARVRSVGPHRRGAAVPIAPHLMRNLRRGLPPPIGAGGAAYDGGAALRLRPRARRGARPRASLHSHQKVADISLRPLG